jgi:hypothetical protein
MNNLIEQYELAKEIYCVFENIEPKIRGRIYKIIEGANAKFTWEINYYCRLTDEVQAYTPSATFGPTLEKTELMLMRYIKRFEEAKDWRVNEYFI